MITIDEIAARVVRAAELINSPVANSLCRLDVDTFKMAICMMIDMNHSATGADAIETAADIHMLVERVNKMIGPYEPHNGEGS